MQTVDPRAASSPNLAAAIDHKCLDSRKGKVYLLGEELQVL